MSMITRFAPSPTGYLHLGHAYAASCAFAFARDHGGTCLLRIEDIDTTRCRAEFTDAIYEDLSWLGFEWPNNIRVQSEHFEDYANVIESLRKRGLLYRCFKTRKQIMAASENTVYRVPQIPMNEDQQQDRIAKGEVFAWRLSMERTRDYLGDQFQRLGYSDRDSFPKRHAVNPWRYGDVILARKDIGTSYHIAVTHDDALQDVTHVVRGEDLSDMTDFHVLLQTLMDWPTPIYHHHPLILKIDGEKLSKRSGDTAIRTLREEGLTPAQVLDMAKAAIDG